MTSSQLEPTLRPATEADLPFLLELRRQTITPHQLASGADASERTQRKRLLYRFECAQVVEHDGAPVGIPARRLYERLGFVVVSEGRHELEMRLPG